jgi:hypothetical protein
VGRQGWAIGLPVFGFAERAAQPAGTGVLAFRLRSGRPRNAGSSALSQTRVAGPPICAPDRGQTS